MALISLMGAKGAPGVTTTTLLLANLWPSESLVVDADPMGGDVALRLMGADGRPLSQDRGLMSLLPAARRGMAPEMALLHAQRAIGGQQLLAGMPGPEQALAVTPLWSELAANFRHVDGVDVFADCGQVHARSSHLAMLEAADAVIVVFRPRAWSVVHTRRRLESLADVLGTRPSGVGVVCVAGPRETEDAQVAAQSLRAGLPWVHGIGLVAYDPKAVQMFEGGVVHRPERTLLARSGRQLGLRLHDALHATGAVVEVGEVVDEGSAS